MSIEVELARLADAAARYRFAYLLTSSEQGPPRAVAVMPQVHAQTVMVPAVGKRTLSNVQARPDISLVWPPQTLDEYSLIVDGRAQVVGQALAIVPTHAVLHRPAPPKAAAAASGCTSDCVRILLGDRTVG